MYLTYRWSGRRLVMAAILLLCALSTGCTALTNPTADGIPVRLLPPELLGPSKTSYQTIPLTLLRQPQPDVYRLDTGDVLGVFIEGYLGEKTQPLPVQAAPLVQLRDQNRLAPGAGFPVPVNENGEIALPLIPKLSVKGKTLAEAREAIRDLYEKIDLAKAARERLIVSLLHQRQQQVLVFRQEATAFYAAADGPVPISKRNTGFLVDLPAYQNDVLHALAKTGGLPDLDAYNEIIIQRDGMRKKAEKAQKPDPKKPVDAIATTSTTIRIPLRTALGEPLPFEKDDVILHNGDVIFLEARDEQVFYTGGLLPPGKHMLPRDHDLDALEAVALVRGPLYNGAFGGSNLSGTLIQPGLGNPSPSLLTVLRRVPNRGQLAIVVDLRAAVRYPQERLVIRPGDVLLLQEKPAEAIARYMSQTFFNFNLYWNAFRSGRGVGVVDVAAPDRLPGRAGSFTTIP
jgi:protein involved in polysaccharide export with SLBB domain